MNVYCIHEYLSLIEQLNENYTYSEQIGPNAILGNQIHILMHYLGSKEAMKVKRP